MKNKAIFKFFLLLLVVGISAGGYYYLHRGEQRTDDAAIDGHIAAVSPKIQGYVKAVYITDNQLVNAGDLLLEIDPQDYIIRRDQALAALSAARAAASAAENSAKTTSVSAPANADAATAQVAAAQATWEKAAADRSRAEALFDAEAYSRQQLDQAIAAERSARGALDQMHSARQAVNTAPTAIAGAQDTRDQLLAQVKQAEAVLAQAESDLANTKIVAAMDGRITKRSVEPGNFVQPGQQLASVVGGDLWVTANFKETQLMQMRQGQRVDIKVDAFPDMVLHGKVESLQAGTGARFSLFPAENATGNFVKIVQRVPVKIVFDEPLDALLAIGPGMSVEPTVYTESVSGHD